MAKPKTRAEFTIKRIRGFLVALVRSKRGIFGIVILLIAAFVALFAPLLTPYNPIYSVNLSSDWAQPAWARYLPGGGALSQNMVPVEESSQLQSPNAMKEFNVTVTPANETQNVIVQQSAFGISQGGPGSLAVTCDTAGLPINSSITIQITTDFYYPYSGIPGAMNLSGAILANRIEGVAVSPSLILRQNWLTYNSPGVASYNETTFGFGANLAGKPVPIAFSESNFTSLARLRASLLGWQEPLANLIFQSQGLGLPVLAQEFPRAGSYGYGIQITVTKLTSSNAETLVYVDGLDLRLLGSTWGLLGTDGSGRDVFSQLVYGTRVSLYVGLVASIIGVVVGLIVGLVSAYVGGIVDEVLMRFTDALLVLPGLPLMIVLITVLANGQYNLNIFILVIGFLGWMGFARVVRSQVLSLKERPYVEAAKAVGAGTPYILFRHILPNVVVLIYVTLALSVPGAIVAEAAFSFLGFIDVNQMSWGRMLNSTIDRPQIWWVIIPPGLAIAILSMSFILIGYAMDDILNPKLRVRR